MKLRSFHNLDLLYILDKQLQKNGKIGRINVESSAAGGKTNGEITIPTSLGMAETALIGAAIETIDRIGPSKATVLLP